MKIRGKNGQKVISEKNINYWITLTEFSIICRLFFYIFQRKNECIQLGEKNNKGGTVFSIKSFGTIYFKIRKAFEWRPSIHETSERHLHNVRCALNSMFLKFQHVWRHARTIMCLYPCRKIWSSCHLTWRMIQEETVDSKNKI